MGAHERPYAGRMGGFVLGEKVISAIDGGADFASVESANLLEAGVRIMHYHKGLLHAKTVTVDRQIALIGSANLDARSFWLNFEVTAFIYDDDFASQVRFMQTDYLTHSTEVELHQWRKRSSLAVFRDSAAQLLGPLL